MVKEITARGDMVAPSVTVDLLISNIKKNVANGCNVGHMKVTFLIFDRNS